MGSDTASASLLGHALLALVYQQPMSGYDLRKMFAESHLQHFSSSPGSIYPALKRLEKDGLIEGVTEQLDTLRPRRVYHLTKEGTQALRRWLERPVTRKDVINNTRELTLRFAFMGQLLDDEATVQFLNAVIGELAPYVDELDDFTATEISDLPLHGRLAIESGVDSYRSFLKWARKARRRFRARMKVT
jgi:DNA-binding PadR family transcriptional regulator